MHLQPFQRLYGNLYLALVQLWPGEIDSRVVNMVYLMMGIFGARSVQTGRIAAHVPVAAKKMSIVRRLERFLDNGAMRVRAWYEPIAVRIIAAASVAGDIHLVLDTTWMSPATLAAAIIRTAIGSYHARTRIAPLSKKRSSRRTILIFFAATGTCAAIRPVCTLRAPKMPIIRYTIFTTRLSISPGHSCTSAKYKLPYKR